MYHYIAANEVLQNKFINNDIDVVTQPSTSLKFYFSSKNYFIRIAKLYMYICIVLVNFRKNYVKQSHCAHIHF